LAKKRRYSYKKIDFIGRKIWRIKEPTNQSKETGDTTPASSSPLPQPTIVLSATAPAAAMVTFPVNPLAFIPKGMTVNPGLADRKVRNDLVVPPTPPL
jgi:hypothetical protein